MTDLRSGLAIGAIGQTLRRLVPDGSRGAGRGKAARGACVVATILAVSHGAWAAVRHEGKWPDADKAVSLDVEGATRQEAIRKLADAAGWSVVMPTLPLGASGPLDLHVKNQPAGKVLDLILGEADFVATRDGTLIRIAKGAGGSAEDGHDDDEKGLFGTLPSIPPFPNAAPAPPTPPTPPTPPDVHRHSKHGEDRIVTGGHVTIEKDETVGDVTVLDTWEWPPN